MRKIDRDRKGREKQRQRYEEREGAEGGREKPKRNKKVQMLS